MKNNKAFYQGIYLILVRYAGASIDPAVDPDTGEFIDLSMDNFVDHHTKETKHKTTEWRFQGKLGFGGKYHADTNQVSMYPEDSTPERRLTMVSTNRMLKKWEENFKKYHSS